MSHAMTWWMMAADQGHPDACAAIARHPSVVDIIEGNFHVFQHWMRRASVGGCLGAQNFIGVFPGLLPEPSDIGNISDFDDVDYA